MNIQKAHQDFITSHEVDNDSPHTIRNYRKDLELFIEWLQSTHGVTDTDDLQLIHLRGWVSYLQKNPSKHSGKLNDTTVRQYAVHLQVFCRWLEHEGIIEKPITTRFKLPKVEEKFIPTFTPDDVKKLLNVCDEGSRNRPHIHKALSARNRAIVSVLIDTGRF